jgi:hypothetical protein
MHPLLALIACNSYTRAICKVQDLPYYSKLELCGGAVMVSFFEVPPLASDSFLTMLHPLLENMLQMLIILKFLALEFPFHGWRSPEIEWGKI